jgi:flavorubredoxin
MPGAEFGTVFVAQQRPHVFGLVLQEGKEMSRILVTYTTFTGKTRSLAQILAEAAREAGADVTVKEAQEVTKADLYAAEAVAFGTPNPFGSISGEMKALIERVWGEYFGDRPMVAFVVPSSGGSDTLEQLERLTGRLGFERAAPGLVIPREEVDAYQNACRQLGKALVAAVQ